MAPPLHGLRRGALAVGVGAVLTWSAAPLLAAPAASAVPEATTPLTGAVIAAPGAASSGYTTKVVVITQGSSLSFINVDQLSHTVTSIARDRHGNPLFSTSAAPTSTAAVAGVSKLPPGEYSFLCQFHPNMTGNLIVRGLGGGSGGPVGGAKPTFPQPLRIPRVLTGSHVTIPAELADVRVLPHGPKTLMWTYGGSYPGPTIRRPAGATTKVTYVNRLPAYVGGLTVHLHGDHHRSADDGQPASDLIAPGHRRTYTYPLTDGGRPERAAFDFYHDHRMDETGRNVWNGLQGMFIVDDRKEQSLRLPSGRYDVPLLVSERSFDANNQLVQPATGSDAPSPPGDQTVGDHILVNGVYAPHLDVAAHRYRFRLLNGSNFTSYEFHLSDGQAMTQVGTGSGLLPAPVRRTSILLGPAQRADIVVDFHGRLGKNVILESIPRTDTQPGGIGSPTAPIMQFRVTHPAPDMSSVPKVLDPPAPLAVPAAPTFTWTLGLTGDLGRGLTWTINGRAFDPTRADAYVALGSVQHWRLVNASPLTHYIHLHEEQWRTVSRDGRAPPPWERGFEDTWRLDPGEVVDVAAKMTDYTGLFMLHCHMLDHEDHGMMAQFRVVKPGDPRLHGLSAAPGISGGGVSSASLAGMATASDGDESGGPPWMHAVVRLAVVASIAPALVAGAALVRRRSAVTAVAARATGIALLAGLALTHAADLLDKLAEAPYLAALFGGLILVCGVLGIALARGSRAVRPAWGAAAVLSALTLVGYVLSRTVGLPQIPDHVGMWLDPVGIASLVCETALLALGCRFAGIRPRIPVRRWRKERSMRVRLAAATAAVLAVAGGLTGSLSAHASKPHVLLVCSGTDRCPKVAGANYFRSLQLAVDHAGNGDWILVWPGRYKEAVDVTKAHGLTSGLHIRGMNRNGVLLDGRGKSGSGITVTGVNNTWVENMTAQHYRAGSGNGFFWTGVDGYWGRYLSAFDTTYYGVYAYDSTSTGRIPSVFAYVDAWWNADSGIYIGGCRDCHAVVTNSRAGKNGIGYSGTNAGGELVLMNSEWLHNATGMVPNTLTSEPDPPQQGVTIVNNYVHDNNDSDVPGTGFTAIAPIGYGIDLAGGWDNIVRDNLVTNEKHGGVVMHWLFTPPVNNQILSNRFRHVAYGGGVSDADIVFDATGIQNCAQDNVDITGGKRRPASTSPTNVAGFQSCGADNPGRSQNRGIYEPGNPVADLEVLLNAVGITETRDFKGVGPHPEAAHTMPNPCAGVPDNPWCGDGDLLFRAPSSPG